MKKTAMLAYGGLWPSVNLLQAYNGERSDRVTEHYPLGNGYRNYSPRIMRFTSPDGLSPFGNGGRNACIPRERPNEQR
ncbi:RHS repeat-associated core domain-containing protein [Pseudomonas sp. DCB_AW]|uniref:RHS repeat-associated core domain-containing protein n=1 Tax=Pseudomonas sp. DCB_AW TaxID=2993596 RepID=UPI002B054D40|nr:RHS repeat-associated core domain-containing protein [Pseudomonas sp. DCB_AW]